MPSSENEGESSALQDNSIHVNNESAKTTI